MADEKRILAIKDIAWLAGIIEGEGCITFSGTPTISVAMTDKDVIEEVARLWNKPIYIRHKQASNWKQQYCVVISGTQAVEWMFTLYTLLKSRRRKKILDIIPLWKIQNSIRQRDDNTFPCGHSRVAHNIRLGDGKDKRCKRCYILKYQKQNKNRRLKRLEKISI